MPATYSRPAVVVSYMAKFVRMIEPNLYYVDNQYTHKHEYLVIAGTSYDHHYRPNTNFLGNFVDYPSQYVCITSYGYDRYGRVVGDITALDHIGRLSYKLIVSGICKWYRGFDANDGIAAGCEQWARVHRNGVWRTK